MHNDIQNSNLENKKNLNNSAKYSIDSLFFKGVGTSALLIGTRTAFAGLVIGVSCLLTLLLSRAIVLSTRKFSPTDKRAYRIYVFIISATFGTIIKMTIERFLPGTAQDISVSALWTIPIGVPFVILNDIDDHNPKRVYTYDFVFSIIYTMVCVVIGIAREFLTRGSIFSIELSSRIKFNGLDAIWFATILLGIVYALVRTIFLKTKIYKKIFDEGVGYVRE